MAERMLIVNPARRKTKRKKAESRSGAPRLVLDHGGVKGLERAKKGVYHVNPARRRAHRRRNSTIRFHRNPIARPSDFATSIVHDLTDGALGAVGGIVVDVAMKPLPLDWKVGAKGYIAKGAGAVLLGVIGSISGFRPLAKMSIGAMTTTLYSAAKEHLTGPMGLGEFTTDDAAQLAGLGELQQTDQPQIVLHPVTGQPVRIPAVATHLQ